MSSLSEAYRGRKAQKPQIAQVVEFLLPFLVIGSLVELLGHWGIINRDVFPLPSAVLYKLWTLTWDSGVLFQHLGASFYRLTVGYLLAVGLGIITGALLALNRMVRDMFEPVLSLLISVPTIAWVPVLLITMGLGDKTVITTIFLGGFFAITYNTMRGIEMVDKNQINAGRIMGVKDVKLFISVLLPASLVAIITGLRLGIGYSWRALVGGEMLSAMVEWGVGKMIYQARYWNDVTAMLVGLLVIGVVGLLLDRMLLKWLERKTVEKWGMLVERG